jgi:hypothetical protein
MSHVTPLLTLPVMISTLAVNRNRHAKLTLAQLMARISRTMRAPMPFSVLALSAALMLTTRSAAQPEEPAMVTTAGTMTCWQLAPRQTIARVLHVSLGLVLISTLAVKQKRHAQVTRVQMTTQRTWCTAQKTVLVLYSVTVLRAVQMLM